MQTKDMAEKRRIYVDGKQLEGLVAVAEYVDEKATIEVPEFDKIRVIQNNVQKINPLECTFKIQKNSETLKLLNAWFDNNEVKDVTMERTDAHGVVFEPEMFTDCEMNKLNLPAYAAESPIYSQVAVRFVPFNYSKRV
jgi:hypothetical protein